MSTFRRLVTVMLAGLVMFPLVVLPATGAEGDFIVDGGGWGHGVGLSQYGAQGMALAGRSVNQIIDHYYNGAQLSAAQTLSTVPAWVFGENALAVNVASKRNSLDFWVTQGTVDVCHRIEGDDSCSDLGAVTLTVGQRLRVTTQDGETCVRARVADGVVVEGTVVEGDCWLDFRWDDDYDALPENRIQVDGLTWAKGYLALRSHDEPTASESIQQTFDVTVRIGLEDYLEGIAEVPFSWHEEALKTQAVAARSFAVATVAVRGGANGSGRLQDCGCHIRRTTADQVYNGWLGSSTGTVRWNGAVAATADRVVTHPASGQAVVTTFYSSSTGGSTENVEDVFGGPPQPHLKAKNDPWSLDPAVNNPYGTWVVTIPNATVTTALGWEEVRSMRLVAGPPGSRVRFQGVSGGAGVETTWTGWQVRQAFGLRSPYIAAVTREGPPPPPFTDIDTSVHYDDIGYIWRADVTRGCNPPDNTLYCPTEPVTRQQMATFLARVLGLPSSPDEFFVDVAASVHERDINAIAATGVTRGCNPPQNDRFCPERPVTRGEMAAFLVRSFEYEDAGEGDLFVDDDDSIFEGDIDRLATAGVTRGCNPPQNDRYCPNDPVTREQMASFLARAMRAAELP